MAAAIGLGAAGCTGSPEDTSGTTASAPAVSPTAGPEASTGTFTLEDAGKKAHKSNAAATVISIESESAGTQWEVKVAADDGTEFETLFNASDGSVVRGPDKKNTDAEDLAENRTLITGAQLGFVAAAALMRKQVTDATLTELNLDGYQGTVVWEGNLHDASGVEHEVKIDAVSGKLVSSATDAPGD